MFAKKYWILAALVVVLIGSLVITPYLPLEWMCDTNNMEYVYHGFCIYGSGPMGWLALLPVLSLFGLGFWALAHSALWMFGKFRKGKKQAKS